MCQHRLVQDDWLIKLANATFWSFLPISLFKEIVNSCCAMQVQSSTISSYIDGIIKT
jgi:hypothetical protein